MQNIHQNAENYDNGEVTLPHQEVKKTMVNVTDEGQIFECEICGNIVEVVEVGGGELVCCGEPMAIKE